MRWMWIDSITAFEAKRRLVAVKNISRAEDHLHDHFAADEYGPAAPVMPTSLIIEGMAQTAGILVGSVTGFREKVVLAKVVRAQLNADAVPGETLRYEATLEAIDERGGSTSGIVSKRGPDDPSYSEIGRIDLIFSHVDQNLAGMEFPEDNFVFSENFRTILAAAGLLDLVVEQP